MRLIELENVSKSFTTRRGAGMLLGRGGLGDLLSGRRQTAFEVLRDITFTIDAGEAVGLIGANGSGKSTLLKMLAGVTAPTKGRVTIRGRVASLLELGAGFHPLLTGRENVYLNGRILGMTRADIDRVFNDIVAFSGIEEFIDSPVDTYSSGMFVRLGFAVAVHANPDIFLVDEVLSVGDEEFQRRCRERIGQLREQGKTILFVSHDLSIVNALCDRVILLSQGRMIERGSTQETIDYYLRQIGRKNGIHTISSGPIEAIVSHGRLSTYYNEREVSAPSGFQVHIRSLGSVHNSTAADWNVVARADNACVAVGSMPRLPLTHTWRVQTNGNKLTWTCEIECVRPVPLDGIDVNLFLSNGYKRWVYRDETGTFPEILPEHHNFMEILPASAEVRNAAAYTDEPDGPPPFVVHVLSPLKQFRLQWSNTDYVMGCRVLQIVTDQVGPEKTLAPGNYELFTVEMELSSDIDVALASRDEYRRGRTVRDGDIRLQAANGSARLFWRDTELTKAVGIYTSMLIHNVWNDSQNLHWAPVQISGSVLRISGRSRRFPFAQHWEFDLRDGAVHVSIWLEAVEGIDVQEYHTSIGLRPEFDRWQTDHESGAFPDFEQGLEDWHHANRDYALGTTAKALSSAYPSVILRSTATEVPCRMTAVNTGFGESARVLQALRTPEAGKLRFEAGRHLYFQGVIRIEAS
ncbi:MAG TPA: ABC transporter ATP-binding protein [Candidatus Hydrogenedentes bacterium]|nr:ABC transporter ATP-binding protein [Candidatus Hydrogenedentota bacterium]